MRPRGCSRAGRAWGRLPCRCRASSQCRDRQAYRYIEEAQLIGRPVPVVETATAVTFKLPPSLVDAVRARAAAEGTTISDMVSRALRAFLGEAGGNG